MPPPRKPKKPKEPEGITRITVKGFKSLANETSIDIRPLTILAGPNSSGKSSIMQPLLLLKQTLEAPYDPGALRLDGAHVDLSSSGQVLARRPGVPPAEQLLVGLGFGSEGSVSATYEGRNGQPLKLTATVETTGTETLELLPGLTHDELAERVPKSLAPWVHVAGEDRQWSVLQDRCFLRLGVGPLSAVPVTRAKLVLVPAAFHHLVRCVHVGGLRGLPGRMYPRTGSGPLFPGRFDPYTGSLILDWQQTSDPRRTAVAADLAALRLADDVTARAVGDVGVEVFVSLRPVGSRKGRKDTANIVDVGTSVQHVLPVVVALHAAEPGRLVYIEQPEIHLHPRAQVALASILADAAKSGVRVVAETHSSLLLLGIRTLIADGKLDPSLVRLHWFERGSDGVTTVTSRDVDANGAWGDWPEDFADVSLKEQVRYLEAVESRLFGE